MKEINLSPVGYKKAISLDDSVIAAFVTGSFVNGYFRGDSDIDLVAVSTNESRPIKSLDEKLSLHYLNESSLRYFEIAKFYCTLANVPLHDPDYVQDLSSKTKREMVIKESKKLQNLSKKPVGDIAFTPWDIVSRHFTRRWGIEEPTRLVPLERMLESSKSREILEEEYVPIFEELVESGFLVKDNENYSISRSAVLNKNKPKFSINRLKWLLQESRGGWVHLVHSPQIVRNVRSYYFPKIK